MLGLVRQVRPTVLHLRDLRVAVGGVHASPSGMVGRGSSPHKLGRTAAGAELLPARTSAAAVGRPDEIVEAQGARTPCARPTRCGDGR